MGFGISLGLTKQSSNDKNDSVLGDREIFPTTIEAQNQIQKGLLMANIFAISALTVFSFATSAHAQSIVAQGKVVYKMPSGEIVFRNASLEVPSRGQGDVILRSGDFELKSHAFKSHEQNGRIVFNVIFLNPPGAPENTVALYKGTYLRGSNLAMYYGDAFTGTYTDEQKAIQVLNSLKAETPLLETSHPELTYAAGFQFSAAVGSN